MTARGTVAVTGANGFVGRHLVRALRQQGLFVRPLVRTADATVPDAIAIGDLAGPIPWLDILKGVDCVVHCAGMAHVALRGPDDLARVTAINVEATRSLAGGAAAAGVQQFIYLSSAKVMGEHSGSGPWTEDDRPAPADAYAQTKADAEAALAEVSSATSHLNVTLLRPPLVYGPGVRANFLRLLALADTPWPIPLASANAPRSMVFVDNLVAAIITCIGRAESHGQTFFVADGKDISVAQLLRLLRASLQRADRLVPCPPSLLELGARLTGRQDELRKLLEPLSCSSARLKARLGWAAPVAVEDAIRITAQWYRDHGRSASAHLR